MILSPLLIYTVCYSFTQLHCCALEFIDEGGGGEKLHKLKFLSFQNFKRKILQKAIRFVFNLKCYNEFQQHLTRATLNES